jgi:hypothetical protein
MFVVGAAVAGTTSLRTTKRWALRPTDYVVQFGIGQFNMCILDDRPAR